MNLLQQRLEWEAEHPVPEPLRRAERAIVRALADEFGKGEQRQFTTYESFSIACGGVIVRVELEGEPGDADGQVFEGDLERISPGVRSSDPSTSARAARDVAPRAGSQRHRLLVVFRERSYPDGMLAEQACRYAGVAGGWRRVSELERHGYLEVIGERTGSAGSDARVFRITPKGLAVIA